MLFFTLWSLGINGVFYLPGIRRLDSQLKRLDWTIVQSGTLRHIRNKNNVENDIDNFIIMS